jgi:guanyl-specific ribonuclease Sa
VAAPSPAGTRSPSAGRGLLALQRMAGNRATCDLLQRKLYEESDKAAPFAVPQSAKTVANAVVTGVTPDTPVRIGRNTKKTHKLGGKVYVGGDTYGNRSGDLTATSPYTEWDTQPYQAGTNRGTDRVVMGAKNEKYYTGNHYNDFVHFS